MDLLLMMTITKTNKSASYDQHRLKALSDGLCDDIENLLETLDISEYKISEKMISMNCPIHQGDNPSALNLYYVGDSYRGNWKCRTHSCEEIFKPSILGFIRGCLSNKKYDWYEKQDKICSFQETIAFAESFLGNKLGNIKISNKQKEKTNFINAIRYVNNNDSKQDNKIPRSAIISSLNIPSQYFLDRGFSSEILTRYDVGDCKNSDKPMSGRAVVPVYDEDHKFMVGCTGRATSDKCDLCNCYHSSNTCPDEYKKYLHSKWRHNAGFKTQNHLYNYWFAKEHITKTRSIILVESPGNVWRLEEAGIHNSVAIFGSSLADIQKMIIDISGAMTIFTIMDSDEAGQKAAESIKKKCERIYNVYDLKIDYPDVASMSVEQIKQYIIPRLNV